MHALRALSQDAPARRSVCRRDVLLREDASRRGKETCPHEGKKSASADTRHLTWVDPGEKLAYNAKGEKAPASVAHPGQAGAAQLWAPTRGCGAREESAEAPATRDISATAKRTPWSGATLVPAWYQYLRTLKISGYPPTPLI